MDTLFQHGVHLVHFIGGLEVKKMKRKHGEGEWSYSEKGKFSKKYPTLVFLHGIGGSKEHWPIIVRKIPSKYHCLTVDLPGHGGTTFDEKNDHPSIHGYVEALHEFLGLLKHDFKRNPIFLVGVSLGGMISLLYAHKYADFVKSLALLCPAYPTPEATQTEFYKQFLDGNFKILTPTDSSEFKNTLRISSFSRLYPKIMPNVFSNAYLKFYFSEERRDLFTKVLKNLVTEDLPNFKTEYVPKFKNFDKKTLVLWGENDQLLDCSGAQNLQENLQSTRVVYISKCGHAMQLDQPDKVIKHLKRFYKKQIENKNL